MLGGCTDVSFVFVRDDRCAGKTSVPGVPACLKIKEKLFYSRF